MVVTLTEAQIETLKLKLRYKVRYHLGSFCPDVDDIVQESLVRFLRAEQAGKIERPESPGAFLNGVCNNVILEYRRRLWRAGESSEELPERPNPGLSEAEDLELRDAVNAALSQLGLRDCRILTDIFLVGRSPEEVCAENGFAESHLKVVLFRAKARFRKIYTMKPASRTRHMSSGI
jgi:RNA polymerase sigma-70 factor (ECF subfamily)